MLIYTVIQTYLDRTDRENDSNSFINCYSFSTEKEAVEFMKIARKTQTEDDSRYHLEITTLGTVEDAVEFLNEAFGREKTSIDEQLKVSNYV